MKKKICLVTGANAGIGRQAASQIADKGYHVILACRNSERGEAAVSEIRKVNPSVSVECMIVDLGLRESVIQFAEAFGSKYGRLDVLIHNAAVFNVTQKKREDTSEGVEKVWATNHLGPVLLTQLLLEKLKKSENGRILTVSSKGLLAKPFLKVDLEDPEFKTRPFNIVKAYYQSKLAQVMYTYWLAECLKNTKITVNCIRVTAVKIDITRHPDLSAFMKRVYLMKAKKSISPEIMAETYAALAVSEKFKNITGTYFDENACSVESGRYSRELKNINALMSLTQSYVPELRDK